MAKSDSEYSEIVSTAFERIEDIDLREVLGDHSEAFLTSFKQACSIIQGNKIDLPNIYNSFSGKVDQDAEEIVSMGEERGHIYIETLKVITACENFSYVYERKLRELGQSFLTALVDDHLLVASMLARGLHELAAFTYYVQINQERKISVIEKQIEPEKIYQKLELLTRFMEKVYYGSDFFDTGHSKTHIDEARSEYKKRWKEEAASYGRLCDFVHPNYGSNALYGCGSLTDLEHKDPRVLRDKQTVYLINSVCISVKTIDKAQQSIAAEFTKFSRVFGRLRDRNNKLANLFRPMKLGGKNASDGFSFETAIDLTSTSTGIEQVTAIYDFLEKVGATLFSRQLELKGEQLFDVVQTDDKKYYFKISMDKSPS